MPAPALAEPRATCPACGGSIHPIAGRCKHCKVDLTRYRAGGASPTAARPRLVALGPSAHAPAVAPGHAGSNGHAAAGNGHAAVAPGGPTIYEATEVIDTPAAGGWSRRWPMLVAAIAILAILGSLAVLILDPFAKTKKGQVKRLEGPAPEAMRPDPAPTPAMPDLTAPVPPAPGGVPDPTGPAPSAPSTPNPAPPGAPGQVTSFEAFLESAVEIGCRRLTTCGQGDPLIASYCASAQQSLGQMQSSMAAMCTAYDAAAARSCLDAIASFPCPAGQPDLGQMSATLMGLQGCSTVCGPGMFGSADPDDP